jgi:hypothetical protein
MRFALARQCPCRCTVPHVDTIPSTRVAFHLQATGRCTQRGEARERGFLEVLNTVEDMHVIRIRAARLRIALFERSRVAMRTQWNVPDANAMAFIARCRAYERKLDLRSGGEPSWPKRGPRSSVEAKALSRVASCSFHVDPRG